MDKYASRWGDKDLRRLETTNCFYEIVRYYGGYLWYCDKYNEDAFETFYYLNRDNMKQIFVNRANADAKRYFGNNYISGRKMRKILITGKNRMVRSYEWVSQYVEYILNKCMENEMLIKTTLKIVQEDCEYCKDWVVSDMWKTLCAKRLLGFQYTLLREVSERGTRVSASALTNIEEIENSEGVKKIIKSCHLGDENKRVLCD